MYAYLSAIRQRNDSRPKPISVPVEVLHHSLDASNETFRTASQYCLDSYINASSLQSSRPPALRKGVLTISFGASVLADHAQNKTKKLKKRDDERTKGNGAQGEGGCSEE